MKEKVVVDRGNIGLKLVLSQAADTRRKIQTHEFMTLNKPK